MLPLKYFFPYTAKIKAAKIPASDINSNINFYSKVCIVGYNKSICKHHCQPISSCNILVIQ